jgi:hypothetical protein
VHHRDPGRSEQPPIPGGRVGRVTSTVR